MAVPIEGSLKVHRFQTLSWQHLVSANLSLQAEKSCQAVSSSRKKFHTHQVAVGWWWKELERECQRKTGSSHFGQNLHSLIHIWLLNTLFIQHLHSNCFGWTLSFSMAVPIEGSLKVHRFQTLSWQHLVSANLSLQAEKSCQAVSSSRKKFHTAPPRWRWWRARSTKRRMVVKKGQGVEGWGQAPMFWEVLGELEEGVCMPSPKVACCCWGSKMTPSTISTNQFSTAVEATANWCSTPWHSRPISEKKRPITTSPARNTILTTSVNNNAKTFGKIRITATRHQVLQLLLRPQVLKRQKFIEDLHQLKASLLPARLTGRGSATGSSPATKAWVHEGRTDCKLCIIRARIAVALLGSGPLLHLAAWALVFGSDKASCIEMPGSISASPNSSATRLTACKAAEGPADLLKTPDAEEATWGELSAKSPLPPPNLPLVLGGRLSLLGVALEDCSLSSAMCLLLLLQQNPPGHLGAPQSRSTSNPCDRRCLKLKDQLSHPQQHSPLMPHHFQYHLSFPFHPPLSLTPTHRPSPRRQEQQLSHARPWQASTCYSLCRKNSWALMGKGELSFSNFSCTAFNCSCTERLALWEIWLEKASIK